MGEDGGIRTTQAMSEEQLKAADTDAALKQDKKLSDEELAGAAGGASEEQKSNRKRTIIDAYSDIPNAPKRTSDIFSDN